MLQRDREFNQATEANQYIQDMKKWAASQGKEVLHSGVWPVLQDGKVSFIAQFHYQQY